MVSRGLHQLLTFSAQEIFFCWYRLVRIPTTRDQGLNGFRVKAKAHENLPGKMEGLSTFVLDECDRRCTWGHGQETLYSVVAREGSSFQSLVSKSCM